MALQMLRDFAENIKAAVIYTVFVDERGVVLDREQLVPCIRWFDGSLQAHGNSLIYTRYQTQHLNKLL